MSNNKVIGNCCQCVGEVILVLCLAIPLVAAGLVAAGPFMFSNDPFIDRFYKGTIWGYGAAGDVGIAGVFLVVYSCCESPRMRWVRAAAALLVLVGAGGAFAVSVLAYQQVPVVSALEGGRSPNSQPDRRDLVEKQALGAARLCEPLSDAVIMLDPAIVHEAYACDLLVFQFVVDAAVEAAASLDGHLPAGFDQHGDDHHGDDHHDDDHHDDDHHGDDHHSDDHHGDDHHGDDHHGDHLWRRLRGSDGQYDNHYGNDQHFKDNEHFKGNEHFEKDERIKNNEQRGRRRAPVFLPTVEEFEHCVQGMNRRYMEVDDEELRLACLLAPATSLSLTLRVKLFAGVVAAGGASLIVGLMFACWLGSASRREGRPSSPPVPPSSAPVPPSNLSPAVEAAPVENANPAVVAGRDSHDANPAVVAGRDSHDANPAVVAGRDSHDANPAVAAGHIVHPSAPKASVVGVQPDSLPPAVKVDHIRYPEL